MDLANTDQDARLDHSFVSRGMKNDPLRKD